MSQQSHSWNELLLCSPHNSWRKANNNLPFIMFLLFWVLTHWMNNTRHRYRKLNCPDVKITSNQTSISTVHIAFWNNVTLQFKMWALAYHEHLRLGAAWSQHFQDFRVVGIGATAQGYMQEWCVQLAAQSCIEWIMNGWLSIAKWKKVWKCCVCIILKPESLLLMIWFASYNPMRKSREVSLQSNMAWRTLWWSHAVAQSFMQTLFVGLRAEG